MDHDAITETTTLTEREYELAVNDARNFCETLNSIQFERLEVCYRIGRIHATTWTGGKIRITVPLRWLVPQVIPPMSGADAVEAERKANRPPQSNADWNEAAEVHDEA